MKPIHTLNTITLMACTLMTVPSMAQTPQTVAPAPAEEITQQQAIARAILHSLTLNVKYHTVMNLPRADCEKKLAEETILNGCPDDFRKFYKEMLANWYNTTRTYDMDAAGIKEDELLAKYGLTSYGNIARHFKKLLRKSEETIPQSQLETMSMQERKKIAEHSLNKLAESIIQVRFDITPMLVPAT